LGNNYIMMFEFKLLRAEDICNYIWGFKLENQLYLYHIDEYKSFFMGNSIQIHQFVSNSSELNFSVDADGEATAAANRNKGIKGFSRNKYSTLNSYNNSVYSKLLRLNYERLIKN
jgi:hypothetical protein